MHRRLRLRRPDEMKTRLTEALGIEVPIVQAPMAGASGAALAIEVARAGGLGSVPCRVAQRRRHTPRGRQDPPTHAAADQSQLLLPHHAGRRRGASGDVGQPARAVPRRARGRARSEAGGRGARAVRFGDVRDRGGAAPRSGQLPFRHARSCTRRARAARRERRSWRRPPPWRRPDGWRITALMS